MAKELTQEEIDTMAHALGSSTVRKGKPLGFRNYFCTSPDDRVVRGLVESGHMKAGGTINNGQDQYFSVTALGIGELVVKGFSVKLS